MEENKNNEVICDDQGRKLMTKIYDAHHNLKWIIRHDVIIKSANHQIECKTVCTPIKNGKEDGTEQGYDSKNRIRFARTFENGVSSGIVLLYDVKGKIIPEIVPADIIIIHKNGPNKLQNLPQVDDEHYLTITKYRTGLFRSVVSHLKKNNQADGLAVFWWPNGNKSKEAMNNCGRPKWIRCYNENEVLISEEKFESHNYSVLTVFYSDGKTPARVEEHWRGLKGGTTKYFDLEQNVVEIEEYWNGVRIRRNMYTGLGISNSRTTD